MPTLFIFFGLRFMFFSNDHLPMHIHVIKGKGNIQQYAIYQVDPNISLLENKGLSPHEIKLADMVIEENKDLIIARWNEFYNDN